MIGEVIGNFRVTSRLGAGAMGEVFLAQQTNIDTTVAVKVLRREISADTAQVERFFNEARAVSRIKHSGICKIFDVGFHTTGHAYLIMEHLDGETLGTRIQRLGQMLLAAVCDIGRQTAGILEATHAAGITHRDLKPDNIFIIPDSELASRERVKILDFGIAKLTGTMNVNSPRTVGTMGTPTYMAPEQWGDSSRVDWRADIYSLGCLLFEMCAARPPFVATNFAEACAAHLGQQPPKLRSLVPAIPEAVEAMLDAMLAKSPYSRPPLRDVAKLFEQLGAGHLSLFADTLPPAPRKSKAPDESQPMPPGSSSNMPRASTPTPIAPSVFESNTPIRSTPVPTEAKPQTTLSSAAGVTEPEKKSRAPIFVLGGVVVVGGGIAAILAASSGGSKSTIPDAAKAEIADAAVAQVDSAVVSLPPPPPPRTWTKPEFVDIASVLVMSRQATRAQYKDYLSTLSDADAKKAQPLDGWSTARPDDPVAWVTFEQARRFCQAAGGDLLSSTQWIQASKGSWRIGTSGPTEKVLRDWTSTVTDGLAEIRGGHSKMNDAERARAISSPLSKTTESHSPGAAPQALAGDAIGIRCAKGYVASRPASPAPVPPPTAPKTPTPAPRPAPAPRPRPTPPPGGKMTGP